MSKWTIQPDKSKKPAKRISAKKSLKHLPQVTFSELLKRFLKNSAIRINPIATGNVILGIPKFDATNQSQNNLITVPLRISVGIKSNKATKNSPTLDPTSISSSSIS